MVSVEDCVYASIKERERALEKSDKVVVRVKRRSKRWLQERAVYMSVRCQARPFW